MKNFIPKTDRKRGLIYSAVRAIAASRRTFATTDFPFHRTRASLYCRKLMAAGELKLVRPAKFGSPWPPAVYARTEKLSPVTPRPHHS